MKFGTLLVLLAAILAGAFAVISAKSIISRRAAAPHETKIVVAAGSLPYGTEITSGNVIEVPWSTSILPDGAFHSTADLLKDGKRIVLSKFEANEPILSSRLTGAGQRASLATLIAPGMRAVTVRVDDVRGVAGFVLPGDRVDVLLSRLDSGDKADSYADVLLQNVKVLAVDQLASESQDKPTVAKAVTVEVTTEQAEKLVLASGVGSLSLVLRQPGAVGSDPTRRIGLSDLGASENANAAKKAPQTVPAPATSVMEQPSTSTVTIIRRTKSHDYSVYSEP